MKNIILASFLFLILFFLGCKKKENSSNSTTTSNNSTPTSTVQVYNGQLQAERYITWNANIPSNAMYAFKGFLSIPAGSVILTSASKEGTLKANGTNLGFMSSINMYYDSTGTISFAAQRNFQLISSTLPSFTYNNPDTFQVYPPSLAIQINDSLDKTKNYIIPLSGLSYYSEAICLLSPVSNAANFVAKTVPAGSTQITFSPADFSPFTSGTFLTCRLVLKRFNTQTFSGKNFKFECNAYNDFVIWFY